MKHRTVSSELTLNELSDGKDSLKELRLPNSGHSKKSMVKISFICYKTNTKHEVH